MTTEDNAYGKLTREMCKDKRITDADRTIYAFIKSHVNWRVIQTFVASELDISLSKVKRSINRLDAAGYLSYYIKETEAKRERRNIKMLDASWVKNEPPAKVAWVNSEPQHGSNLNHPESTQVKNDLPGGSILNHAADTWVNSEPLGSPILNHEWVKNEPCGGSEMNHNVAGDVAILTAAIDVAPAPLGKTDEELSKEDSAEGAAAYARIVSRLVSANIINGQSSRPSGMKAFAPRSAA